MKEIVLPLGKILAACRPPIPPLVSVFFLSSCSAEELCWARRARADGTMADGPRTAKDGGRMSVFFLSSPPPPLRNNTEEQHSAVTPASSMPPRTGPVARNPPDSQTQTDVRRASTPRVARPPPQIRIPTRPSRNERVHRAVPLWHPGNEHRTVSSTSWIRSSDDSTSITVPD